MPDAGRQQAYCPKCSELEAFCSCHPGRLQGREQEIYDEFYARCEYDEDIAVQEIARAFAAAEGRARRLRELAKRAKSQAAAPDYDEEAIRDTLWAVVDAALERP